MFSDMPVLEYGGMHVNGQRNGPEKARNEVSHNLSESHTYEHNTNSSRRRHPHARHFRFWHEADSYDACLLYLVSI